MKASLTLSAFALTGSACALSDPEAATTTMTEDEIRIAAHTRTCDSADAEVRCHARVLVDAVGEPRINAAPAGYAPSQLRSAYKITGSGAATTTIAIIGAFGYPTAESDLASYRSQFGLPACTSASG